VETGDNGRLKIENRVCILLIPFLDESHYPANPIFIYGKQANHYNNFSMAEKE